MGGLSPVLRLGRKKLPRRSIFVHRGGTRPGLEPAFFAQPTTDFAYDFFVGFLNHHGGITTTAVQVKATERPVKGSFSIERKLYERWAYSNIPVLILLVDVKRNQMFYAWPSPKETGGSPHAKSISIPVTQIDEQTKELLHRRLVGGVIG